MASSREKAVLVSDEALNVNPIPQKFWHFKGIALHGMKKFEDALKCYREAIQISQDNA